VVSERGEQVVVRVGEEVAASRLAMRDEE